MACSTKKDKLINREFQALNTKFNVLYNGNVALEKGIVDLKLQYKDDYWKILPVERMIVSDNALQQDEKSKNTNFALAEEKATKAIQKRSMYIDGKEKNSQINLLPDITRNSHTTSDPFILQNQAVYFYI